MLILALNISRDSQAINKTRVTRLRIVVTSLTAIVLSLYKEAAGNLWFSKQQYVNGSALFRPAARSGLETAVFAEGIYNCHLSDAERALPACVTFFCGTIRVPWPGRDAGNTVGAWCYLTQGVMMHAVLAASLMRREALIPKIPLGCIWVSK